MASLFDKYNSFTPEQIYAIKLGLQEQLETSLNYRGVRDDNGRPILKYAFIKRKHIKRIKSIITYNLKDGRKVYIRIFK